MKSLILITKCIIIYEICEVNGGGDKLLWAGRVKPITIKYCIYLAGGEGCSSNSNNTVYFRNKLMYLIKPMAITYLHD